MDSTDIIKLISERRQGMSKQQKVIADYIRNNYDKAAYMTAGELCSETGVSEATIVRFAAELGFGGYRQFRIALLEYARPQLTTLQRIDIARKKRSGSDLLTETLKSDMLNIEKTIENIDRADFEVAVDALLYAKNIYIMGMRSSAPLASFASYYLSLVFDNIRVISNSGADDIFQQLMRVGKGDVVLGISFVRYSKNIVSALEYAKQQGAAVIALTDTRVSPLAAVSDCKLIVQCDTESFVDSLVAPLSVLNALIVSCGAKKEKEIQETFTSLERIWDEYEVYKKE